MVNKELDLSSSKSVHLIGIGGAGMGAIAEVLSSMGHTVSGSDIKDSHRLDRLRAFGVKIFIGHDSGNVGKVDFVARSTAISDSNIECLEAVKNGIPLLSREKVLRGISKLKNSIAVSGTHGKTTTSSMLSLLLREAGLKPSFIIGGEVNEIGTGAVWDEGELLVIEADESDASFLGLKRNLSIITNLEEDHLEYFGGFEALYDAFVRFGNETDGMVLLGIDDENSLRLSNEIEATTVGLNPVADWTIGITNSSWRGSEFFLTGEESFHLSIPIPGVHNVKNASIAAVAGILSGVEPEMIKNALVSFGGVARRFEHRGSQSGVVFVDDYAHLPSEVESTIEAAMTGNWKRIFAVFQPHRYSRTESIGATFSDSFKNADCVVITDVFAGGESLRSGVSGGIVFDAIKEKFPDLRIHYLPDREDLIIFLSSELSAGDLCLTMGAGDITSVPEEVKRSMRQFRV